MVKPDNPAVVVFWPFHGHKEYENLTRWGNFLPRKRNSYAHTPGGVCTFCDPFTGPDSPPSYPANLRVTAPSAAAAAPTTLDPWEKNLVAPAFASARRSSGSSATIPLGGRGFRGRLKRAVASTFPLRVWFFLKWERRPLLAAWPTPCSRPFSSEFWGFSL